MARTRGDRTRLDAAGAPLGCDPCALARDRVVTQRLMSQQRHRSTVQDLADLRACRARMVAAGEARDVVEEASLTSGSGIFGDGETPAGIEPTADRAEQRGSSSPEQREQAAGELRDTAGDARDHAAGERDCQAQQRDDAGGRRDLAGERRDDAGDQRDRDGAGRDDAAVSRDHDAALIDSAVGQPITTDHLARFARSRHAAASDRSRASRDRQAAARERGEAQHDRVDARDDREAGAGERAKSQADRDRALDDRRAGAVELEHSSHDALTGAYLRGAGCAELKREIMRARRERQPLVLAFVDVDGLKAANDSAGHAAGDRMLRAVADALRAKLRSHDLIIRYGGDEFICAVSGLEAADAATRLGLVNVTLAALPEPASVTVGLAQLTADDSPADLVARADAALYAERHNR